MQNIELMQGWVIDDANHFIQAFKQLTYIQDRKRSIESRNDGFYYFELLSEFEIEIESHRKALFESYNNLQRLHRSYDWLPIWKRVIQRTNDIMQLSKLTFPFEITDELFKQEDVIHEVINFLGRKEEDGDVPPIEAMKSNSKSDMRKSAFHKQSGEEEQQSQVDSKQEMNYEFFKQSHLKYLGSVKDMYRIYSGAMDIDETNAVYTFNHDKPLSVNLEMIYNQMLGRNESVSSSIIEFLKMNQSVAIIRKSQIQNDLASLEQMNARFLSESPSVKNFQSQKYLIEGPLPKSIRRYSNFMNFMEVPSFLNHKIKTQAQEAISKAEKKVATRKSRDPELLLHAITQIERHKSLRVRKVRESTTMMKAAEFNPNRQGTNGKIPQRNQTTKTNTNVQTSKHKIDDSLREKLKKNKLRLLKSKVQKKEMGDQNCGAKNLQIGIVVQDNKNVHLLCPRSIPSYKEYIRKNGIQALRASTCF